MDNDTQWRKKQKIQHNDTEKYVSMFTNLCHDIKLASNYAFNFDLTTEELFNCHRMEDSYKQIENTLEIIYYVYMDTVDYELRFHNVPRAKPSSLGRNLTGIAGASFIPNFAYDLTEFSFISKNQVKLPKLQP